MFAATTHLNINGIQIAPQARKWISWVSSSTGSLIAFSTKVGKTAKDGTELNSVYCSSCAKSSEKEDVSLDQVFRNVRLRC